MRQHEYFIGVHYARLKSAQHGLCGLTMNTVSNISNFCKCARAEHFSQHKTCIWKKKQKTRPSMTE